MAGALVILCFKKLLLVRGVLQDSQLEIKNIDQQTRRITKGIIVNIIKTV